MYTKRKVTIEGTTFEIPGIQGKRVATTLKISGQGSDATSARKDAHTIAAAIGGKRKLKVQESADDASAVIVTDLKPNDAIKFLCDAVILCDAPASEPGSGDSPAL